MPDSKSARRALFDAVDARNEALTLHRVWGLSDTDLAHLAGSAALLDAEVQRVITSRRAGDQQAKVGSVSYQMDTQAAVRSSERDDDV